MARRRTAAGDLEMLKRELLLVLETIETAHDKARASADANAAEMEPGPHRDLVHDALRRGTFEGIVEGARHQLRAVMSVVWPDVPRFRE